MTKDIIKRRTHNFQDLTGQRFGNILVVNFSHSNNHGKHWNCECDCGTKKIIRGSNLRNGNTSSCGCIQKERFDNNRAPKHGGTNTLEFVSWSAMIFRCTNINNRRYANYGGRGIKVCDRWLNSFENFLEDMGSRPSRKHSIDRIDNNGDYNPINCRWATMREQGRNRQSIVSLTFNGKTCCIAEWAEHLGIKYNTLYSRWTSGMPLEKLLIGMSWKEIKKQHSIENKNDHN